MGPGPVMLLSALAALAASGAASGQQTYYQILGITEFAEGDEIKKAYRTMSLQYHPDKFKGDPAEAQEKMVLVNEAFHCLKDPAMRRMYEYYEHDYESMAEYEQEIQKERVRDLYLFDSSVHILWHKNINTKFKPSIGLNHTWVVVLYDPQHAESSRQASEFKTFARIAERRGDLRAGAINCATQGGLCSRYWKMVGKRKVPMYMIFPRLQPDESMPTDFEEFDVERSGWPSAKELERRATKVAAGEAVQVDGDFLEQNITRNPRARGEKKAADPGQDSNGTADERVGIWVVWFYHGAQCTKTDACDKTAPGFRKLAVELKGIARFAAINCKAHARACKGHASGATSIRIYVQRGTRHFVESFTFDYEDHSGHKDTVALSGAAQVMKLLVKPAVELWYPPHPYQASEPGAAQGAATPSSAAESGGAIDLSKVDAAKLKVAQLKNIIASHGERCVGCADKNDFVNKVREIAAKEGAAGGGGGAAQGEL